MGLAERSGEVLRLKIAATPVTRLERVNSAEKWIHGARCGK